MGAAGVNMANESLEAVGMCDFSLYAADTELQAEAALQSQLVWKRGYLCHDLMG